ncbi:hypothetical protein TNCV_4558081 [Trichonephila clavipes]|nr:hypothetical protein TNCV_4558081 [Trichonephila clavipes]
MPLDNKCRIGPLAGAPPDTCAVVIITETESGFITEDDTSPVCHTPSCPRSAKSSRHCHGRCGVSGKRLSGRRLLKPFGRRLLMVILDGTGCLKEVSGVESMLGRCWCRSGHFLIARSSRSFVFLGRPDPSAMARTLLTFCDPLLPTPSNYHIAPTEVAADTSIRPTCFSEAYYTAPIKVRQLLVLPPVTS